jgi:ribonuclease G
MANPKNRAAVEEALRTELERDRTKTYVVEISPLGLVEMTRQNVTDGPREVMTKKCPTCGGDGIVISEFTAAVDVERKLRSLVTPGSRSKAFKVEVAATTAWLIAGPGGSRLRELEELTKRRFIFVPKEGEHLDHFHVIEQGTLEKVAPKLSLDVGKDVEVKLGEVGLHDTDAGAGKVDDIEVVVGAAAKLVGKKVRARITAVADGLAWAELLDEIDKGEPPLTAEAEAERPTRAPRKSAAAKDEEVEEAIDVEEDEEEPTVEADGKTPTPAKKRTRRGSRGGRNRKKKSATTASSVPASSAPASSAAGSANGSESVPETVEASGDEPREPVIHVPERPAEDGEAPATPRKKTRRGSRGGRNRKKKSTAMTASSGTETATEAPPVQEPSNGDEQWDYTPMSEWDFGGDGDA